MPSNGWIGLTLIYQPTSFPGFTCPNIACGEKGYKIPWQVAFFFWGGWVGITNLRVYTEFGDTTQTNLT